MILGLIYVLSSNGSAIAPRCRTRPDCLGLFFSAQTELAQKIAQAQYLRKTPGKSSSLGLSFSPPPLLPARPRTPLRSPPRCRHVGVREGARDGVIGSSSASTSSQCQLQLQLQHGLDLNHSGEYGPEKTDLLVAGADLRLSTQVRLSLLRRPPYPLSFSHPPVPSHPISSPLSLLLRCETPSQGNGPTVLRDALWAR